MPSGKGQDRPAVSARFNVSRTVERAMLSRRAISCVETQENFSRIISRASRIPIRSAGIDPPLGLPKGRPDQANGSARQSTKNPGGIIPLWGARSSRNRGAASFRYEGRHHPGIGGRLPQESAPQAFIEYETRLRGTFPLFGFRDRRDEFGAATALDDLLRRLPGLVELPMPRWAFVGRIQDRMFEKGIERSGPRTCFSVHYLASRKTIGISIQAHFAP